MYSLRFDMRAPAFGADRTDLYAAAIDMCAWAEQHGALAVVLCEHHGSEDGYLPAPLMLASAIAARTERLLLNLVVILPFYDPVRLAEDIAVLDNLSRGRASIVFGLGYRPEEFEHFGVDRTKRGTIADAKLELLRALLRGEEVYHQGRRIRVTPPPHTPGGPTLMWGGASLAAARRAGRYGLGLLANGSVPGMQQAYLAACREHGHPPGPALLPDPDTPTVTFVADDVDAAWDELGPYLLHDARGYAEWNPAGGDNSASAGISPARDVAELRAMSRSHRIISTADAIAIVRRGGMLNLSPLCGGIPPEIAWPYLRRVGEVVLPEAARSDDAEARPDRLSNAFRELMSTDRRPQ
ncbi:luciferase-like monooxygenase family protein [Mycolicibacterium hassiacum DSM 44199]|uniref:Luciferase-like monooxygenase family protein n=1 Tax=Mycolicibacterium hassiacum (strain DSM 44199 / CIP 105218 / JCM 12690 / 3849) TaxID=1122247 RepID=K5BA25_MYCHD|nr:LLM class flavin-dependent oxidoreductase [Mycolicibacterium hassiacum]EKF21500.1 luciferase-like monooxygenase family protein [Mycolicibacterium hassiacum DSM 44199]MBX5486867.1 LLM class flavin-dependent oxidoreductase [Mycolicibacterium hassiacum]MDA4087089.1 luciferase [Mycolicibacterium hassiacum DSM 44199]VCT89320.1 Alkanal monooxygenase alpha chain [Mycolicibacterium hassiacum DSM 44199]